MSASNIPKETLRGSIQRQLYNGTPRLVFVEHPTASKTGRCVCEVTKNGEGYKAAGPRWNWQGDVSDDAALITAEYLDQTRRFT